MGTNEEPVNNLNKARILEEPDYAPECRLTAPWVRGEHISFRINLTIVSVQSEETQDYLSLPRGEAEVILKEITHLIESLQEKAWRQHPLR